MTSSDGAGMIELANMLKVQSGYDVYIYNASYGGSSVVPQATNPATPDNCWQIQAPDSPLSGCMTQVAVGGKIPQFVIWVQGEAEAQYSGNNPGFDMVTNYKLCLEQLRQYQLTQWGVTYNQCTWMITPVGKINYGNTKYVLQSQQLYYNGTPGVRPGSARYNLNTVDGVHIDGPGCRVLGDLYARDILNQLGIAGFANCGPGPQIIYSQKGGYNLGLWTNSTTGIVALPGTSGLTGFQVWDYYYTALLPITIAYVSGGLIWLQLANSPGDGNKVHVLYEADNAQAISSPAFDQQQPFLNWGSPLLPCYGITTAN